MVSDGDKLAFIRSHCPTFTFHPNEQFFPCSIEHLLQGSTLTQRARGTQDNVEPVKSNPSPDELGDFVDGQKEYFVSIAPAQLQGHAPAGNSINAPVYVALVEVDDSFIDIYYISLYAFQGSATFRCCPKIGHKNNVIAHEFGRHQGDIEHCIVRSDTTFTRVLSVGYEAHDKIAWFFPGTICKTLLNRECLLTRAWTGLTCHKAMLHRGVPRRQWSSTSICLSAEPCLLLLQCTHANSKRWHW